MKKFLLVLMSTYSINALAEVHPVIFKDDQNVYSQVYFGMTMDEYKVKLKETIFECNDKAVTPMSDALCSTTYKMIGIGVGKAVVFFKKNVLVGAIAKINTDNYDAIVSNYAKLFNDAAQIENKLEKKNFFAKPFENQYAVWSYPNYAMQIVKIETKSYEENKQNYGLILEAVDSDLEVMKSDAEKSIRFKYIDRQANVDLNSLHLNNGNLDKTTQVAQTTQATQQVTQTQRPTSITVKYDNYKKETTYKGKVVEDKDSIAFLRAWKNDKDTNVTYQIYISVMYAGDWRFYNSAYDIDGNNLDLTKVTQKVENCTRYGCTHDEHVGLNITKEYLTAHKLTGINVKLGSKSSKETTVFISGIDVADMLNATQN